MTRTPRTSAIILVALIFSLCAPFINTTEAQRRAAARSNARPAQNRNSTAARRAPANNTRAANQRGGNATARGRAAASNADRRNARGNQRNARDNNPRNARDQRNTRANTRAARLAEARRREAARRAEAARQAALARVRAYDQSLRTEAQANIARDSTIGEDLEVRRVAVAALGNLAGTVVVMDPQSGRIYTVVNQDWGVRRAFKPCSTIKLVTGLAGLNENVIDPAQTVNIGTGSYQLNLTDSLAYSNNVYFQRVGGNVGFERMLHYARLFGLGERTGINHAAETPGRLPAARSGFALNRMSSHGDDFAVTPVQLAAMAAAIGNGGTLLVPHLPRTPRENVQFQREVRRRLDVPQEHLRRLLPGMIGAVNYGTARGAQSPGQTVAGKTGSCMDNARDTWLGLFTSYAPVEDPRLAVAVVIRGSGARGRIAAGVAGHVYRGLAHRFGRHGGTAQPAITPPQPRLDPVAAAAVSDEEADDDEANSGDAVVVSEAANGNAPRANAPATNTPRSGVRTVLMPIPSRPATNAPRPSAAPATAPTNSATPGQQPAAPATRPRRATNP